MNNLIQKHSFYIFLIIILSVTSCAETYNKSNSIPYQSSIEPFLGTWSFTYYTRGINVDTVRFERHMDWVQVHHNSTLVILDYKLNKIEFKVEEDPSLFFEGTMMGSRLWGTMKFETGDFAFQRFQWQGQKLSDK